MNMENIAKSEDALHQEVRRKDVLFCEMNEAPRI